MENIQSMLISLLDSMTYEEIAAQVKCSRRTLERAKLGFAIRTVYEDKIRELYAEKA